MERNITLDYFKIFLCILVITIHIEPLFYINSLSSWVISNGLARIAVPSFFVINGYYIHSKINSKLSITRWFKRMIIVFITWTLIYMAVLTKSDCLSIIIFSVTGIYHLWYLPSLIGGVLVLMLLKKIINNNNILLIIAISLFLIGYYIQDYFFPISNHGYRMILYRNFIFFGFPFIFIGYYIKQESKRIVKTQTGILVTVLILSIITLLFESSIYFTHNDRKDFFVSLLLLTPSLFILILKNSKYIVNDGYISSLASGIFYTHILGIYMINTVFPTTELKILLLPLFIFLSMILSAVTIQLNKRIKIFL